MSEIAKHIGHRVIFRTVREVRCHDCDETVLLPLTAPVAREPIAPTDPNRCERHPGQHVDWCTSCAADAKAAQQDRRLPAPTSTEQARRDARLVVAKALADRKTTTTEPTEETL